MSIEKSSEDTSAELEAQRLLDCLRSWPFLRVERCGTRALLYGTMGDKLFGTVDLITGLLTVEHGACLDLGDAASRQAAEALIRRRIDAERFEPQQLDASP
jgi:hypothetical protein